MSANITISDELRRKLETLAGANKTADDLANEAVARYIPQIERDTQVARPRGLWPGKRQAIRLRRIRRDAART